MQKGKLPADSQLIIVDRNVRPQAMVEHSDKPCFSFVQSDWQAFLQDFFSDPACYNPAIDGDRVQIVPAPFAPHLFFDWLCFSTRQRLEELGRTNLVVEQETFDHKMNLPYEYTDSQGTHLISRAGWMCPVGCIEPHLCPAVKGVRDWDLEEDLRNFETGQLVKPSQSAAAKLAEANLPNGVTKTPLTPNYFALIEAFTCHHFSYGISTTPARQLFEARVRLVDLALSLSPERPEARAAVGTISHCHGVVSTVRVRLDL
jgi:hypothetical protein